MNAGAMQDAAAPPYHLPVLLGETIRLLEPARGGLFFDGTVGGGGHAEAVLEAGGEGIELIGCDLDSFALAAASERLRGFGPRTRFIRGNFADFLAGHPGGLSGILLDLGFSNRQISDPARGFSFQKSGPLDMRFDPEGRCTAADLVNRLSRDDLSSLIHRFGEEHFHMRIASAIVRERAKKPLKETRELADIVVKAVPRRHGRIHPATRTFQALRIAVNRELENLEIALCGMRGALAPGGRAAVISFHSLEDRLVKQSFRRGAAEGVYRLLTRKPARPGEDEKRTNPAARSAKLRAVERL